MSFFDKLEEIRQRPIETRRRILALTLFLSMALVIGLWLSLLKSGTAAAKPASAGPKPWKVIKETFQASTQELKKTLPAEVYLKE